jgi:hypothetical protein
MKKTTLIILSILSFGQINAQQTPDELKIEISKLESKVQKMSIEIDNKKNIIEKLNKENTYYKESLYLINSEPKVEKNNFEFKITSAKGDIKTGKVYITALVENKGLAVKFQPNKSDFTDPKGNNYSSFNHKVGKFSYIEKLQKNVPTKFIFEFDKVIEQIPMIKSLTMFIYNPNKLGRKFDFYFSNIPVIWENMKSTKKEIKKTKMKVW